MLQTPDISAVPNFTFNLLWSVTEIHLILTLWELAMPFYVFLAVLGQLNLSIYDNMTFFIAGGSEKRNAS